MKIMTPVKPKNKDGINSLLLGGFTQKLEAKLEYIHSISIEINKNKLDMVTAIVLDLTPIERKIPTEQIKIMPIEFDSLEDLLKLLNKSLNKINKKWQDKTIAIRSQLTLFD